MLENLCGTCSECCHDVEIVLTHSEFSSLSEVGTTLSPILHAPKDGDVSWNSRAGRAVVKERIRLAARDKRITDLNMFNVVLRATRFLDNDQGIYSMKGACGNLDPEGNCSEYAGRPRGCVKFPLGGAVCVELQTRRKKHAVSEPPEFTA